MADKLDYKKEYRDLYLPSEKPALAEVPPMSFIQVDGKGAPAGQEYQDAVGVLYALSFAIKMGRPGGGRPPGYFEYVVPPLEGLWWCEDGPFDFEKRDRWRWTAMIRQPEFVTQAVFDRAAGECRKKKPELDVSAARFGLLEEGLCAQLMHVGPYEREPASLELLGAFIRASGCRDLLPEGRRHHEIYLSDPRRTAPERLKTVLRHPVERVKY